ncbi:MAG: tryptophan-rich sensory protein [Clostridia bacterium]|nr:tryptophan-rich sensory protein [Clostridia bacterium]
MKRLPWKPYAFWILLTEAVGGVAALLIRTDTELYRTAVEKPPLSPPAILFPIVWTILYALMGFGIARVRQNADPREQKICTGIYLAQLVMNFFWSILFFKLRAFGVAFYWLVGLWALILWMVVRFSRTDRPAGLLQIPYLLWVTFAGYLNLGVWILNR